MRKRSLYRRKRGHSTEEEEVTLQKKKKKQYSKVYIYYAGASQAFEADYIKEAYPHPGEPAGDLYTHRQVQMMSAGPPMMYY